MTAQIVYVGKRFSPDEVAAVEQREQVLLQQASDRWPEIVHFLENTA